MNVEEKIIAINWIVQRLGAKLKWRDEISLENGLKRTLLWIDENYKVLSKQPKVYIHKK